MQVIKNNGNKPNAFKNKNTFILVKCISNIQPQRPDARERLLLLADARSGWSVIRWREGVTGAVTGWCAQWAGFHQPVSEAVIFPQFHLLSASQAVSSAPGEFWCCGATDSQQHRDTDERKRETHHCTVRRDSLRYFCLETQQLRFWTGFMVSAFRLMPTLL